LRPLVINSLLLKYRLSMILSSMADDPTLYYTAHVFCCTNVRADGHSRGCCAAKGSGALRDYMKRRAKELGLQKTRVNTAGCLDRCELGPAMVIYPEGVWYSYASEADVEEILRVHVGDGGRVERLLLKPDERYPGDRENHQSIVRVARVEQTTPEIKTFELVDPGGAELPPFTAGSHVHVRLGNGLRRSYSLANDPRERASYRFGVLRDPQSRGGSAWMHDELRVDDELRIGAPRNLFPLADDAAEHLLIAGGIGITPILAMGYVLREERARFHLHYCTRGPRQTAFMDEVRQVFADKLSFHHDGGDPAKGIDLKSVLSGPPRGGHLYVCGPGGFMGAVRETARASGWSDEAVHFELFSADAQSETLEDHSFEVTLARQNRTLAVAADKSILQTLREAGMTLASECEEGICGTCMTSLLGGRADHRDQVLTPAEKKANIMICVSRAMPGETLILDL